MKKIILLVMISIAVINCLAQRRPDPGLHSGQLVPDVELTGLINYPKQQLNLSALKGKVVLLDFWSSWCTGCLVKFPLSDSLQREFDDDLQIVLVNSKDTRDTRAKVLEVLKRFSSADKAFILPTVVEDTVLSRLFPHRLLPHYIWIDRSGRLTAVTSSDELSRESVLSMIRNNKPPDGRKTDIDLNLPLYTTEDLPQNDVSAFFILIKGRQSGLGGGRTERVIGGQLRGYTFRNFSLKSLFTAAGTGLIPDFQEDRMIIQVADKSLLTYSGNVLKAKWEQENQYSYDRMLPKDSVAAFFRIMLEDLNSATPFNARIQHFFRPTWILEKAGDDLPVRSNGGDYVNTLSLDKDGRLVNASVFDLCTYLRTISGGLAVLDKTNYTGSIDLQVPAGIKDIKTMASYLSGKGFRLHRQPLELPYLVIKDKNINHP